MTITVEFTLTLTINLSAAKLAHDQFQEVCADVIDSLRCAKTP